MEKSVKRKQQASPQKGTRPKVPGAQSALFSSGDKPHAAASRTVVYLAAAIVLATLISFLPVFQCGFTNLDDQYYVINNPDIRSLSFDHIASVFSRAYVGNYQPLSMLSYTVDYMLSALHPLGYHITSIFLHLLNTLLVFILLRRLASNISVAVFASLLFGLHPLHVESVAWISERKDVLYAFFFIAGLISYSSFMKSGKRRYYGLTIILFICSCLSKAMAVSFPLVLLLLEYLNARSIRSIPVMNKIPFFIISIAFGVVALLAQRVEGASAFIESTHGAYSIAQRFFFINYSLFFYIYKMLIPIGLSVLHPYPKADDALPLVYYLAPVFNLVILGLVAYSARSNKRSVFGYLFFLFTIGQVLQIISVGSAVAAERYIYIASIGLSLIAGELLYGLYKKLNIKSGRAVLAGLAAMLILALGALTFKQTQVWTSSATLWTQMISEYPQNELPYFNRAVYYFDVGKVDLALGDFSTAIRRNPKYEEALNARIAILLGKKDFAGALADLQTMTRLHPEVLDNHIKLGTAYRELRQNASAAASFRKAIALNPNNYLGYMNLAIINSIEGKLDSALVNFDRAEHMDPKAPDVLLNRGWLFTALNKPARALEDYDRAIQLKPDYLDAYYFRALLEMSLQNFAAALPDLQKCVSLNPNSGVVHAKLATLFVLMNNIPQARSSAEQARKLGAGLDQIVTDKLQE
jgi:protein O-mannosyl-transferase